MEKATKFAIVLLFLLFITSCSLPQPYIFYDGDLERFHQEWQDPSLKANMIYRDHDYLQNALKYEHFKLADEFFRLANIDINCPQEARYANSVKSDDTVIYQCALHGCGDNAFNWLIAKGADPRVKNCNIETRKLIYVTKASLLRGPIVLSEPPSRLSYLINKFEIDINAKDERGDPPLIRAAYRGEKRLISFLLKSGANPNITTDTGKTYQEIYEQYGIDNCDENVVCSDVNGSGSSGWMKALVVGTVGALAVSSGMDASSAVEVTSTIATDVYSEGETNQSMDMLNNLSNSQSSSNNSNILSSANTGLQEIGGASLSLTCMGRGACAEYTFTTREDLRKFTASCPEKLLGSCPIAPACRHTTSTRSVVTYSYNKSKQLVHEACLSSSGEIVQ